MMMGFQVVVQYLVVQLLLAGASADYNNSEPAVTFDAFDHDNDYQETGVGLRGNNGTRTERKLQCRPRDITLTAESANGATRNIWATSTPFDIADVVNIRAQGTDIAFMQF